VPGRAVPDRAVPGRASESVVPGGLVGHLYSSHPLSLLTSSDSTPFIDGGAIAAHGHPLARRPNSIADYSYTKLRSTRIYRRGSYR
jgi:hypothetical protein